jgi:diguanylate cyclase (GGDEF)-like protein
VALICVLVLAPAAFGAGPGAARAPVDALSLLLAAVLAGGAREVWQGRRAQLGELAYQDPLTALLNARGLRDRLAYELARHGRHRRELAVLLFDLDGFKAVNDSYGHLEGDRLLRNVAAAMKSVARGQDTLARQGGDEFCVLAPETDRDGARVVAEKVSRAIASASGPSGRLSGSVGVAVYPGDGGTISELLDQADAALREAKRRRYEHRARRAA